MQSARFAALIVSSLCFTALPVQASDDGSDFTDADIRNAIEDELVLDHAVPGYRLDVALEDGIATLTGTVDDLLAKERATRLAETVKGVRAVINRIEVRPRKERSAEELVGFVEHALLLDPATDSIEVDVAADDKGRVTLTGKVESWAEKELCGKVAMGVKGVVDLDNEIVVDYQLERSDYEILQDVERRLLWDPLVDQVLVEVKVEDGNVIITGTVGSAAERYRVRTDAWVAGASYVDVSGLLVQDWANDGTQRERAYVYRTDDEVEKAVEDAMLLDPRVLSFHLDAEVDAGIVTLRGVVDNLKAKRAAVQNARNTVGVIDVRDRLKTRPAVEHTDDKIAATVRRVLDLDAVVERFGLTVDVVNGVAYLDGTVDSLYEKARADEVAAGVNGVVAVVNRLTVVDAMPLVHDAYVDPWYWRDYAWYDVPYLRPAKEDDVIARQIESELFWSPFVDEDEVQVEVLDGVATLTGTVDSWSERRAAAENAYEGGAVWVRNHLQVAVQETSAGAGS